MATVVECLWASEPCESCCKRDECRDEKRVAMLRSERDAARRAGRAEGLREVAKLVRDEAEEAASIGLIGKDRLTQEREFAARLLARAEEVERG